MRRAITVCWPKAMFVIRYRPWASVVAPRRVPSTSTDTPERGSADRESVTRPLITDWAFATVANRAPNRRLEPGDHRQARLTVVLIMRCSTRLVSWPFMRDLLQRWFG